MPVVQITTTQQYIDATRNTNGLAVVKCSTSWCKPCKIIAGPFSQLSVNYPNVRFYSIDIEQVQFPEAANVSSVPTFLLFKNNKMSTVTGANIAAVNAAIQQLY